MQTGLLQYRHRSTQRDTHIRLNTDREVGYTFFCVCHSEGELHHGGVGVAIRSTLLKTVQEMPCGIYPQLMKMQVNLEGGHTASLLSCYAPMVAASQEEKEEFYEHLNGATDAVAFKDKLFVLGDFNARVGQYHQLWHSHREAWYRQQECQRFLATASLCEARPSHHQHSIPASQQVQSQLDTPAVQALAAY